MAKENKLTRRSVLQKTALTGAAMGLSGAAMTGTAAATGKKKSRYGSCENDVVFRGCSEVWVVRKEACRIRLKIWIYNDHKRCLMKRTIWTKGSDFTYIPGQFGRCPVFKYSVPDGKKIVKVEVGDYDYRNYHRCAKNVTYNRCEY